MLLDFYLSYPFYGSYSFIKRFGVEGSVNKPIILFIKGRRILTININPNFETTIIIL